LKCIAVIYGGYGIVLAHLFVKVPWPCDSEGPSQYLSEIATCYYLSIHSKVKAVPCPRTQQANLLACSPHIPKTECQVEKL